MLILANIRLAGIAVDVSSSGIVDTLSHVERTAHSTSRLSLNLNHVVSPVCNTLPSPKLHVWNVCFTDATRSFQ